MLRQPLHHRSGQPLLVVDVGGREDEDGVPGQTLETGDTAGLSGDERLLEDHPRLDSPEGPQQFQYLCQVSLPTRTINISHQNLKSYSQFHLAIFSGVLPFPSATSRSTRGHPTRIRTMSMLPLMTALMMGVSPKLLAIFQC